MISGVTDRAEFTRLRSNGLHVRSKDLRCRYLMAENTNQVETVQVAYSISRKVGNAVVRNRLRRRLRVLFGEYVESSGSPSLRSAQVIVLPGAAALSFDGLQDQVVELMKKIEKSTGTEQ